MSAAQPPLVYLHGLPGGPDELALVSPYAATFFAPDSRKGDLAQQIFEKFGDQPVTLVGFSLGAFEALMLADQWPLNVAHLHLIAAPAPLESGSYLEDMAGGQIFRMARDQPRLFWFVTQIQCFAVKIAPRLFAAALFAEPRGGDKQLVTTAPFRQAWLAIARRCLAGGAQAYQRTVRRFVRPWSDQAKCIRTPVTLWYGSEDNWVPPAMTEKLGMLLAGPVSLNKIEGASHYSALAAALPMIVAQTSQSGGMKTDVVHAAARP